MMLSGCDKRSGDAGCACSTDPEEIPRPRHRFGHTVGVGSPEWTRYCWLLRHAKTLQDPPRGGSDHERRLAPRGRRDADALGLRLGDKGDHFGFPQDALPGLVLCSTATRTVQTTERVLSASSAAPPVEYLNSLYHADPDDVIAQLRVLEDDLESVMVVGHNPTFQQLAATMGSSSREVDRRGFPTCSLMVFGLTGPKWTDTVLGEATVLGLFAPPF
jgi:phosphohistidine phosphatase